MKTDPKVWDWRTYILKKGPDNSSYRHLLLTLSCYMDSAGGSCFPAISTLVDDTSMSRPTVIKYLKKAREDGWIKVKKHGFSGQKWARNEYTASLPESLKKAVKSVNHLHKNGEKAVKQVNHLDQKAVNSVNQGGKTDSERRLNCFTTNSPYNSTINSPKTRARVNGVPIPEPLQPVEGFAEKYEFYCRYLKENFNHWPTATTTEQDFQKLTELAADGNPPLKVIEQTIQARNKSFYPLRDFEGSEAEDGSNNYEGVAGAQSYKEYTGP